MQAKQTQEKPAARSRRKLILPTPQTLKRVHGYNQRTVTTEASDDAEARRVNYERSMAIAISDVIQQHYPGHRFVVKVDARNQYAAIQLAPFMGNYWMKIGLPYLHSDPGMKRVIRAAGEILERYQIPRAGFSLDHFLAARATIPKFLLGRGGYVPS